MVAGPTNPSLSKLAGSNPTRHHFASANGWRYQAFAHLAILSHYGGATAPHDFCVHKYLVWLSCFKFVSNPNYSKLWRMDFCHARPWLAGEPRVNKSSTWKHGGNVFPVLEADVFWFAEIFGCEPLREVFFLVENIHPAQEVITMAT